MKPHQLEIAQSLKKTAPQLGELYEGAVKMLENEQFPGRVRFIAHAVREIANRLPEAVGGEVTKGHLDYHEDISSVAVAWKDEGLGNTVVARSGEEDEPGLRISYALVGKVNALLEKDQEVSARKERNAQAMIHKLIPESRHTGECLAPIINHWLRVVRWFVDNVHETEKARESIDEGVIQQKFRAFENALRALLLAFYSGLGEVECVVESANSYEREPTIEEVEQALSLLLVPQYRNWFFENLQNPLWFAPLKTRGLFDAPPEPVEDAETGGVRYPYWPELEYLKRVAKERPADVREIVMSLQDVKNPLVKTGCIEALSAMAAMEAAKGVAFVKEAMRERTTYHWYWEGQAAATLMLKLAKSSREEAFHVAYLLLEIWVPGDKENRLWHDATARFDTHHYGELVLKSYKQVWEIYPARAIRVLIKTLDRYLAELNKGSNYDRSTHFCIRMENLDAMDDLERDYVAILVNAICEAGKAVIEKKPDETDALLDLVQEKGKAIFTRIEMYLLRFVEKGTQNGRIAKILLDRQLFESPGFRYEYDLPLCDKIDEVRHVVEATYKTWIAEIGVKDKDRFATWFRETHGRDYTPGDFEKYENRMRAAKLYSVRTAFPDLYGEYKKKAGVEDEELRPRPMVGPARWVSPTEGSPATVEEIVEKSPTEVFAYLGDPSHWQTPDKTTDRFFGPKEALGSVFQRVVKQRIRDYVTEEQAEHVGQLDSEFTASYFQGVWDAIRGGEWERDFWAPVLAIAKAVVDAHKSDPAYRDAFRAMLSALRDAFGGDEKSMVFDAGAIETFWSILNRLVRYDEPPVESEHERDPIQLRCSSVNGSALEQVVLLGAAYKKRHGKLFDDRLKAQTEKLFEYAITDVRCPEVLCTFGLDFPTLGWLDEKWLRSHTDAIFAEDMWDAVWGTYVSWGRPSPGAFALLYERGQYRKAVDDIGKSSPWRFDKEPEEGLSEHLMIALYNGWLDQDPKGLLPAFLEKAPAALRGHAAEFLTTGFEELKERPDANVSERLKQYWEQRLNAMEKDRQANKEEAVQFLYWAKNSPFAPDETLGLLRSTLDVTEGEMPADHFPTGFFEGVSEAAVGNELAALECLNKVMADRRMESHISLIKQWIDGVFNGIVKLRDDHPKVREIRQAAMLLADAFGRMHVYDFRPAYQALDEKIGPN